MNSHHIHRQGWSQTPAHSTRYKENDSMTTAIDQTLKIAELNDRFRKGDHHLGRHMASVIVDALNPEQKLRLTRLVRAFDQFTEANDPDEEHDFGIIEFESQKWYWKIDYYDTAFENASEDPSDPTLTRRVLTVMHSSEY
jgi:hypothetical protein